MSGQDGPHELVLVECNLEPGPLAPLLPGDQSRIDQNRKVMAHCCLAPVEWLVEVTSTDFAFGDAGDQAQQPQADGVGQDLEHTGQVDGLGDREGAGHYRDAASIGHLDLFGGHRVNLTH